MLFWGRKEVGQGKKDGDHAILRTPLPLREVPMAMKAKFVTELFVDARESPEVSWVKILRGRILVKSG